jgi:hypothetical protein
MGEVRISLTNMIAVGTMAFVFIWLANRAIKRTAFAAWAV